MEDKPVLLRFYAERTSRKLQAGTKKTRRRINRIRRREVRWNRWKTNFRS